MSMPRPRRMSGTERQIATVVGAERHAGPHTNAFVRLFEDSGYLPAQLPARASLPGGPERRLLLAVVEDALLVLDKHARAVDPRARQLYRDTRAWVCSDDVSWPFAFARICEVFNVDVGAARRAIFPPPVAA